MPDIRGRQCVFVFGLYNVVNKLGINMLLRTALQQTRQAQAARKQLPAPQPIK